MQKMMDTEQAIAWIRKSSFIVALSGAGISTEAGIPDFRGAGGLWENGSLMKQLSLSGFRQDPEGFYRESMKLFTAIRGAKPTLAHRLLTRLEEIGKLKAVVTQNIDGLHHAAGSRKVYELHGTYKTGHCSQCSARYEMAPYYSEIENGRLKVPRCPACDVPIKPDIVLFEDLLPADAWEGAADAAAQCDCMLVFGSSLVVYPAAELPLIALSGGAALVIVNMEGTAYDAMAKVVVRGKLGDFAGRALAAFI
jgi:NAD-dependent deacetylase